MAEMRLTPQQQAVVENQGGTLLVSAAAGSGKTKVLVDRVIRRVVKDGKNIHEFLIITFTNAAAAELRVKIAEALAEEIAAHPENQHLARQMNLLQLSQISTVHAFCGALIRQCGYQLAIPPDHRLMDDSERAELLGRVLEELLEEQYAKKDPNFLLLTDTLGAGRSDDGLVQLIGEVYEKLMSQPDPDRWLRQIRRSLEIPAGTELTQTPWGKILTEYAKKEISSLIDRYRWAVAAMEGDEKLAKKYYPAYLSQLSALEQMLPALDGPWDGVAPALQMDYPVIQVRGYEDKARLEAIKAVRSDGKTKLAKLRELFSRSNEALIAEQNSLAPALDCLLGLVGELDRRFSAEKRRKNRIDFSDQEHLAIHLLVHPESGRPTEIAQEVSGRFCEIMVDEYQDSNRVQETIFRAISAEGDRNRFLVGDVKQSIYGFRMAEPDLFLEKYGQYAPADAAGEGAPRKLILSKNFRSRPEILEAVNHTFSTVMREAVGGLSYGPDEMLYAGLAEYPPAGQPAVEFHALALQRLGPDSDETKYQREANWAANRIVEMLEAGTLVRDGEKLRPVRPQDIAILFRARDPIAIYSRALRQAGVPVAAESGENIFETPEVRMLVNLLRVLSNPHQDVPLLAVLCSPLFRFSNEQLAVIRTAGREKRFYDAMKQCGEPWCVAALRRLEKLRETAGKLSADGLVWTLLHETGLLTAVSAMDGGSARRENLMAVYQLARDSAGDGYLYLYQLLRVLDRAAEAGKLTARQETAGVILTTIHKSKGLEYPVVLLADLSRKFSFQDLNESLLFDGDLGLGAKITDPETCVRYPGLCFRALRVKKEAAYRSEELRVLYVGMTRARDYLIMSYASEYMNTVLERARQGAGPVAEDWAASSVGALGDWVLLAAMNRVEAGALHAFAGRPDCQLTVSPMDWDIRLTELETPKIRRWRGESQPVQEEQVQLPHPSELAARLQWTPPHTGAYGVPSKLTATQLKGRDKDAEAAEGARVQAAVPQLRRPEFILEARGLSATERGTAVHLFLQYADFSRCTTEADILDEKIRLEDGEYLTPEQLQAVEPEMILRLFHSKLGRQILGAGRLIREFKFSLLEDATLYYPEAVGERLLLQGVVDAAIVEEDGVTVIDFKTDRVTEGSVLARAEHYRGQLDAYRRALGRIFGRPVRETILYFLTIGREVRL